MPLRLAPAAASLRPAAAWVAAAAASLRRTAAWLAAAAASLALLALPAPALGARNAEVTIMDDQLLLDAQRDELVEREMRRFRSLGVDRLRVSAFWDQIAPRPGIRRRPSFDAADPGSPAYNFRAVDTVVLAARRHGLRVMISITTPAPRWATGDPRRKDRVWKPKPGEFARFARAVAARYAEHAGQFAILNEPNQPGWLRPQTDRRGMYAPHHYRRLVNASFPAIRRAAPGATILVGELAASGARRRGPNHSLRPLAFLRAFGCVSRSFRKLRSGRCRGFRAPRADAIGHHPYLFFLHPSRRSPHRDDAAIGDSRRLLSFLDRLVARRGLISTRGRRLDVHYTEFGYQTNPPDPYAGISLRRQNRYLQHAAYIAWRTPRIRGLNQFRLTDGGIYRGEGFRGYREFQTGLMFRNFRPKPSYRSFRHPFVSLRRGARQRFWGQVRPGRRHRIVLERRRGSRWVRVLSARTSRHGYWRRDVRRRAGVYRYRWGKRGRRTSDRIRVR